MHHFQKIVHQFYECQAGQATTEYVLILGAATFAAIGLTRAIIGVLDRGVLKLGGQLEKDLKSGREPLHAWKN